MHSMHNRRLPNPADAGGDHPGRSPGVAIIFAETDAQAAVPAFGSEFVLAVPFGLATGGADQQQTAVAEFDEIRIAKAPEAPLPRVLDLLGLVPGRPAIAALAQRDRSAVIAQAGAMMVGEQNFTIGKLFRPGVSRAGIPWRGDDMLARTIPFDPRCGGSSQRLRAPGRGRPREQTDQDEAGEWLLHESSG
jgi:hypothetical protein